MSIAQLVRAAGLTNDPITPAIHDARIAVDVAVLKAKEVTAKIVDQLAQLEKDDLVELANYFKGAQYAAVAAAAMNPTRVNRLAATVLSVPPIAFAILDGRRSVSSTIAAFDGAPKEALQEKLQDKVIDQAFAVVAAVAPAALALVRR